MVAVSSPKTPVESPVDKTKEEKKNRFLIGKRQEPVRSLVANKTSTLMDTLMI